MSKGKTLFEIIEDIKNNKGAMQRDCYYAILVLDVLGNFDHSDLRKLSTEAVSKTLCKMYYSNSWRRNKEALNKPPKEWLGWSNDFENPEYQKRRKMSLGILNKITGENQND